jgi:hypothetical protein
VVCAAPGSKRFILTPLSDIDSNEFGKRFTKGFTDNAPKAEMSTHIPGVVRMGIIFSEQKKLLAGDTIVVNWIPGTATAHHTSHRRRFPSQAL